MAYSSSILSFSSFPPPPAHASPSLPPPYLCVLLLRRSVRSSPPLISCCSSTGSHSTNNGDAFPPAPAPTPRKTSTAARLLTSASASTVFFFCFFSASALCARALIPSPPPPSETQSRDTTESVEEDEEFKKAFESFKSKTYALTVPLRVVALRGSMPPSWIKDFMQAQGRRCKLGAEFRGSIEAIFSDLSLVSKKNSLVPKSAMAADIVSVGDSWLDYAIKESLIEPINAGEQDWFKGLTDKWKTYLCRNSKGEIDCTGQLWAVPYRWGSLVIAYKKSKFRKYNLPPIQDWGDLWRPELAGRIAMVDSPREVVGAVLKHMGASYNTKDLDSEILGGKKAVLLELTKLQKQVRMFDSAHYLKAFGAGDVWVAVGWSSDVIPAAKRMSNVTVIVPKSGASLWTDLWAVPSATRFSADRIGGRVRGPSPLVHQWIDFCLQTARALPFQKEVIPGASPLALECPPSSEELQDDSKGKPKLDSNLIAGVPPRDILSRCEFLEPLSEKALEDYKWLLSAMQQPDHRSIKSRFTSILTAIKLWRRNSYLEERSDVAR